MNSTESHHTDKARHIARAKQLLTTVRHATMATVNVDGTPHNTPFRFLYGQALDHLYWGSHPSSLHSRNILRTGHVFIVLYDATERGGLYIRAENAHATAGEELITALEIQSRARKSAGEPPIALDYYQGVSPQRMWSATPTTFWVNGAIRDGKGLVMEDIRVEVSATELLA